MEGDGSCNPPPSGTLPQWGVRAPGNIELSPAAASGVCSQPQPAIAPQNLIYKNRPYGASGVEVPGMTAETALSAAACRSVAGRRGQPSDDHRRKASRIMAARRIREEKRNAHEKNLAIPVNSEADRGLAIQTQEDCENQREALGVRDPLHHRLIAAGRTHDRGAKR